MISTADVLFLAAALEGVLLATVAVWSPPRGRLKWSFALGMVAFAVEALAGLMLLAHTDTPAERAAWAGIYQMANLLPIIPWAVFAIALLTPPARPLPKAWRWGLPVAAGLVLIAAAAGLRPTAFDVPDIAGGFYAVRINQEARGGVVLALLGTIAILAGLEAALRGSRGDVRWRLKYLILGAGGIFLVRFYFLGQIVLFNVILASYVTTMTAAFALGGLVIALSLGRDRLGIELNVSRRVVYQSVAAGVLGLYLLALGGLTWVLDRFGMSDEVVWTSLVIFVSALGLATLLLSEALRWRVRRVITRNFYRSKYDYREQWSRITKRLGSRVTLDELVPELLQATTDAVEATGGVFLLGDATDGRYHTMASVGIKRTTMAIPRDHPVIERLAETRQPLALEGATAEGLGGDYAIAVPLPWQREILGVILLARPRADAAYGLEEIELLATLAEQAAGSVATARLSESLAQAREFEAFHRLTSFVIHDIKNSISALSMLSENALRHFDDPEFQRDALVTLGRTVDRMKALLGRLAATPDTAQLRHEAVDLAALALEAIIPLSKSPNINLVKELAPLPPIPGDTAALLRVVQNVVSNAVQAFDGTGTLTVKTYEAGAFAVLAIADTGCGMSEEFVRKSLFSPFKTTKKHGWGIGLYQTKGIVEAHGGTIEVSSKEGVGTTFCIKLPMQPKGER